METTPDYIVADTPLTSSFAHAVGFANELHRHQSRKGGNIPYISHLLSVSALVIQYGGSGVQAIAALLHDAIEDQGHDYSGGVATLSARIRREFGADVLAIVKDCTDADTHPKPPWEPRKLAYLAHLRTVPTASALVSACDKLDNARAINADLLHIGNAVFERFTGKQNGTLWYYGALCGVFDARNDLPPALAQALRGEVLRMADYAEAGQAVS